MIRVDIKSEPDGFEELVRRPGERFLRSVTGKIHSKQWKSHSFWRRILPSLHDAYDGICAYSCEFIPFVTGTDTVEHFLPKDTYPNKAFTWDNFRLVCLRMNGRKGTRTVIDPFVIQNGWFILDFPSLLVKSDTSQIPPASIDLVEETIITLDLNGEASIKGRQRWLRDYCTGDISAAFLSRNAPFLYRELVRQQLLDDIFQLMRFHSTST